MPPGVTAWSRPAVLHKSVYTHGFANPEDSGDLQNPVLATGEVCLFVASKLANIKPHIYIGELTQTSRARVREVYLLPIHYSLFTDPIWRDFDKVISNSE